MPDDSSTKRRLRLPWPRRRTTPSADAAADAASAAPTSDTAGAGGRRHVRRTRLYFEKRSLFGEILDWMLAPLLLLWPISVTVTYIVAQTIANGPFDRSLADAVRAVAQHVSAPDGRTTLQLPMPARDMLGGDASDGIFHVVLSPGGEVVAGDDVLPSLPSEYPSFPGDVHFHDSQVQDVDVRVAYQWVEVAPAAGEAPAGLALVAVAETLEKRSQLAGEIIRGVIIPQFVVLPIAVVLVWFGLTRGLAPLADLQARIRARPPDDLSPIDARGAPEEIAPLVSAFNELLARLSQNLEMQQRFLADAAHQMRTPLAGLRTQAELALREKDPQELKRTLRHIAAATERSTHLINQLLTLARAEYQASDPSAAEVVDLVPLTRAVVRDFVSDAIQRGLDLGFEGDGRPLQIVAVPMLVRELLKNLIDNALRYTPSGGTVTVRLARRGEAAFIEVEDTGPGIPEAERPRIFDRFYRILGTNVDGSGLGLAIVREIAQQHGALVRIGNNPAGDAQRPGTLISVEFEALDASQPTVDLSLR